MVKITNGTVTTEVTQGAFDTFYKELRICDCVRRK